GFVGFVGSPSGVSQNFDGGEEGAEGSFVGFVGSVQGASQNFEGGCVGFVGSTLGKSKNIRGALGPTSAALPARVLESRRPLAALCRATLDANPAAGKLN